MISAVPLAILVIAVLQMLRCRAPDEYGTDLAIWHDEPTNLVVCLVTRAEQVLRHQGLVPFQSIVLTIVPISRKNILASIVTAR